MKITLDQLTFNLGQKLQPIYFISGDETLLIQEAALLIRKSACNQGFSEYERFTFDKNFVWQDFLAAMKNLSLFGERKFVELRLTSLKLDSLQNKFFCDYCLAPSGGKVLLIVAPKLTLGWQKIKWLQTIVENNIFLQIWPIESRNFLRWILERFRNVGLNADVEVAKLLAERFEGNLLALAQEIDKLKLLFGTGKITLKDVLAETNNIHADLFALIDYALQGNLKKTLFMLDSLRLEGVEPILVLWFIVRELRFLLNILVNKKTNEPIEEAMKSKRMLIKRIPIIKKALSRHSVGSLRSLLQHGGKIDRVLKGVVKGDAWLELINLIIHLAGTSLFTKNNEEIFSA